MNTLHTDFDLMRSVAASADASNEEVRALLSGFIGRMESVPPSVWGGHAALQFKGVVAQWNGESTRLSQALAGIAQTIRNNEHTLSEAAHQHAQRIAGVTNDL